MIRTLLILLLCTISLQTKAQDYVALESLGTSKALGNSIYQNTERSALVKLIKDVKPSGWIELDKTINELMLASADARLIQDNIPIKEGEDILSLRLNVLLQNGMNAQALKLYNTIQNQVISEQLARLGTLAMLLNQQKAQACLETKTFYSRYKNSSFWSDLNAYCTILISGTEQPKAMKKIMESQNTVLQSIIQSKEYRFEYEPIAFSRLNFQQRALLVSENRITISLNDTTAYNSMPAQHIGALLNQKDLTPELSLFIYIQAAKKHIITEKQLVKKYKQIAKESLIIKSENSALEIIKIYDDFEKNTWNPLKKEDKTDIQRIFILAKKYGAASMLPFIPHMNNLKMGTDLSLQEANTLLKSFLYSEDIPPPKWKKQIEIYDPKNKKESALKEKLLITLNLMQNKRHEIVKYSYNSHIIIRNIIENIDNSRENVKNFMYIYENDFDLRNNKEYTLPPYEVLRVLEHSSKNQNISITLLLTSIALDANDKTKALYWGTLAESVSALSRAGLNRVSDGILAQAILETD